MVVELPAIREVDLEHELTERVSPFLPHPIAFGHAGDSH
jgi:hypothetical protein